MWRGNHKCVDCSTTQSPRQLFGYFGHCFGSEIFPSHSDNDVKIRTDNTAMVYYVNNQGRFVPASHFSVSLPVVDKHPLPTHCPLLHMDALVHLEMRGIILSAREGAPARALSEPSGCLLASEVVVYRHNRSAAGQSLAASSPQGSLLPGMRGGASSMTRTVLAACLSVVRSNLLSMGLLPNVAMIESTRA